MDKSIGLDENLSIKKFIKKNDINHTFIKIDKNVLKNIIEESMFYYDEPSAHAAKLLTFYLRKQISKQGFKVVLNGEGGDEFLGGYHRHYKYFIYEKFLRNKEKIPDIFYKNVEKFNHEKFSNLLNKTNLLIKNLKKNTNDIEYFEAFKFTDYKVNDLKQHLKFFIKADPEDKNFFKKVLLSQIFRHDLPYCLKFEDRNSMAFSTESRTPFADHSMAEYLFSRKSSYFIKDGELKFMLKSILTDKFSKSTLRKKKVGSPGSEFYLIKNIYQERLMDALSSKNNLNEYFNNVLLKKNIEKNGIQQDVAPFLFRVMCYFIWKENNKNYIRI